MTAEATDAGGERDEQPLDVLHCRRHAQNGEHDGNVVDDRGHQAGEQALLWHSGLVESGWDSTKLLKELPAAERSRQWTGGPPARRRTPVTRMPENSSRP